ncbi:hypothetical protein BKG82_26120 [Mycobacteroides chelonae]|uniref:Uncharacterized protein n=1 Tax=Mycobacteroides chelonae TaxID=1774 RepID=A0A1S1LHF8_MYCCH|nr:hypothetical protein [Mycobacteroides chelonae]OHU47137.1 hypothetical protein BKG82_26120 [Mycobacteroides chelonae]
MSESASPLGVKPRDVRISELQALGARELAERLDHMMAVVIVLGDHLADIAELVGLDRDVEDLAITPRVRELVEDPRVRQVLDEFEEAVRRNASTWELIPVVQQAIRPGSGD